MQIVLALLFSSTCRILFKESASVAPSLPPASVCRRRRSCMHTAVEVAECTVVRSLHHCKHVEITVSLFTLSKSFIFVSMFDMFEKIL